MSTADPKVDAGEKAKGARGEKEYQDQGLPLSSHFSISPFPLFP